MKVELNYNLKDTLIDVEIESSVAVQDTYVVLFTDPTSCKLETIDSTPYVTYYVKKVSHISNCKTNLEGVNYSLTIGFYLGQYGYNAFLIKQESDGKFQMFSTNTMQDDCIYTNQRLFNYNEYLNVSEMLGLKKLELSAFLENIINGTIRHEDYSLYDLNPPKGRDVRFKELVDDAALNKEFDAQELQTKN